MCCADKERYREEKISVLLPYEHVIWNEKQYKLCIQLTRDDLRKINYYWFLIWNWAQNRHEIEYIEVAIWSGSWWQSAADIGMILCDLGWTESVDIEADGNRGIGWLLRIGDGRSILDDGLLYVCNIAKPLYTVSRFYF